MRRNLLFLLCFLVPLAGDADTRRTATRVATAAATTVVTTPSSTTHTTPPSAAAVYDWCNKVTLAIPQIKLKPCLDAQLAPAPVRSAGGWQIMWRDYVPAGKPVARVMVVGGIHGDELTSVSIVFRWFEQLGQPNTDAATYHWRVIPLLNPDGLLSRPPRRMNSRGVDLNRNFPTPNWVKEAPVYWEKQTRRDPRRFPGRAPASEPESRWLYDEIMSFKPDVIVSVHAPYGLLDFDGPPKGVEAPLRFGRLHLNRVGIYPGSLGNFGGVQEGIPVVTMELPHALNMPTEAELAHVWSDMQRWLKVNLVDRRGLTVPPIVHPAPAPSSHPAPPPPSPAAPPPSASPAAPAATHPATPATTAPAAVPSATPAPAPVAVPTEAPASEEPASP